MASFLLHFVTGFSFPFEHISLSTPVKPRDEVSVLLLYAKDAKPRMVLTVVGLTCMFALAFMMGILYLHDKLISKDLHFVRLKSETSSTPKAQFRRYPGLYSGPPSFLLCCLLGDRQTRVGNY
jgi:hypothetical protein